MTNKNIDKIGKILSDAGNSKLKEFDIVYLIDATSSMDPFIKAAKSTAGNISKILRQKFPETNFQYGYVFYRDPIDSPSDIHEIIDLTDDVNSLPEKIGKIRPKGGGDIPEDWVGAYRKVNEEINWRNDSTKVIFHLADAGAHGKLFTPYDKYEAEEEKLIKELDLIFEKKIKIFGFVIEEDSRNSFEKCKNLYRNKGGFYEIYNFEKPAKNNDYENFCGKKSFYPYSTSDFPKSILENKKKLCLFGNRESTSSNKENNLFNDMKLNHSTKSLFGYDHSKGIEKPKTESLFSNINENNNEKESLFGSKKISNNDKPKTGSLNNNNNTINNEASSLFGKKEENNYKGNLFRNKNTNTNNIEVNSLFGNTNTVNNNSFNLFRNKTENSIFGNHIVDNINKKSEGLNENKNENNNYYNSFQSNINSSFMNFVVDSIQKVNSTNNNTNNLFNN